MWLDFDLIYIVECIVLLHLIVCTSFLLVQNFNLHYFYRSDVFVDGWYFCFSTYQIVMKYLWCMEYSLFARVQHDGKRKFFTKPPSVMTKSFRLRWKSLGWILYPVLKRLALIFYFLTEAVMDRCGLHLSVTVPCILYCSCKLWLVLRWVTVFVF